MWKASSSQQVTSVSSAAPEAFHVVSFAWGPVQMPVMLDRVIAAAGFRVSHIALKPEGYRGKSKAPMYFIRQSANEPVGTADRELLASLEGPGVPSIHTMILSDRLVRHLPYEDVLAYMTLITRRLMQLFDELQPSVVLGWFDGIHASVAMAVARKMGIPWFAMHFTALPKGLSAFCPGMSPDQDLIIREPDPVWLRSTAERMLSDFEARALKVPTYVSAIDFGIVVARMPQHLRELGAAVSRWITGTYDRFMDYTPRMMAGSYIRKRFNTLTMPKSWLLLTPPARPYALYALQMQPESSIDVWAPFYSNQLQVVETLSRSIPPTHELLVKMHHSDADNYSRRMLNEFRRLPGVRLVSPFASSRDFAEKASLIATVEGTIAIEGAMLGKPVLMFGAHRFSELPNVTRVGKLPDLPDLVREKLAEAPPTREEIIQGLMAYLEPYAESCYNDWSVVQTDAEIAAIARQFLALRDYLAANRPVDRTEKVFAS
jgi:hypothetical protein